MDHCVKLVSRAIGRIESALGGTDDFTDRDLIAWFAEPNAAITSAHGFDESILAKVVHDFHQMIVRDGVRARDFADGRQVPGLHSKVHQDSKGILSGKLWFHAHARLTPFSPENHVMAGASLPLKLQTFNQMN